MGVKEQYRDYVMTGFVKRVEPVVADHGDGALPLRRRRHRVHRLLRRHQRHQRRPPQPADPGRRHRPGQQARARLLLRLPRGVGRRARREARGDHARRPAEDASSATAAPRPSRAPSASPSAISGKNEFLAIESSFHGRSLRDPLGDRQLRPQEGRRPVHARRRLRAHAVLLPLLRRDHAGQVRHALRAPRRRDRPPAPLAAASAPSSPSP